MKVVDYGWTGYDVYQYSRVLVDPNASPDSIAQAKTDLYTALVLEAAEPDDLLPLGIPLDDIIRHARGNPVKYNDPSGHCPICIVGLLAAMKVVDYGWTGYDVYQYSRVLVDPNASPDSIAQAKTDLYTALVLEAAEPDDLLPLGIPLDDIIRHWDDIAPVLAATISRGAGKEVAEQSFKSFTRPHFRDNLKTLTGRTADEITGLQAHHILPQTFSEEFARAGLNVHDPKFGTWVDATHQQWSYAYQQEWREFLTQNPTNDAILEFAQGLSQEYGFETHFSIP